MRLIGWHAAALVATPLHAASGTHLSPWLTVPAAVLTGLGLAWLWWHVGRAGVPASRRVIRRTSLALALTLVPLLVAGTSFVDSTLEPRRYAEVWTLSLGVLGLIVATAAIDAVNSVRLHLLDPHAEHALSADEVRSLLERAERARSGAPRPGAAATDREPTQPSPGP